IKVSLLFGATLLDFPDQVNPTALPGKAGSIAGALVTCGALIAPLSTASAWSVQVRRRTTLVQREALALRLVEPASLADRRLLVAGDCHHAHDRGQRQRAACSGLRIDRVG